MTFTLRPAEAADHEFLQALMRAAFGELVRHKHGLGSAILRGELARARALGKPLRLHTPRISRAVAFYRRHGFVETGRDDDFVDLQSAVE